MKKSFIGLLGSGFGRLRGSVSCVRLAVTGIFQVIALAGLTAVVSAADRPNILWITCEDTNALLGAYGDPLARTPHLDAFAKQAVRYTQAFSYTGVCAPSRSCLITGVYPSRLDSGGMRSSTRLPEEVKAFPEYLRAAGYFTTNNVKTDYNFEPPKAAWDELSRTAHWRDRGAGQPFFSVFNIMVTHQSFIFSLGAGSPASSRMPPLVTDPARVTIPPIHPDTPEFREEWARHYDNIARMDAEFGRRLAELDDAGLGENTIVFFFSDHGTGMPSIKGSLWNMSMRVPLMIRFPEKWRHLAPTKAGGTTDRLVSFVDFAPTVLSLAQLPVPASQQGVAFLGAQAGEARKLIYGGKDRMIERSDCVRTVHDGRFQYLRNFLPHLPAGQFISYNNQHASMRAWAILHAEGKLTPATDRFFRERPTEELYDVVADPWCLKNLADDVRYAEKLSAMRAECRAWMLRTGDLGLLPEHEAFVRSVGSTPWDIALDATKNPLPQLLEAADLANRRDPSVLPGLLQLMKHRDAAMRWWGVTGILALGIEARGAQDAVRELFADASPSVRVAAAEEALRFSDRDHESALAVLESALQHESALIRLAALNALDRAGPGARPAIPEIEKVSRKDGDNPYVADYVGRMSGYLPARLMTGSTW
ncbi:MAG: sulfatase-like hydrolase/transferase [Opitutaceae bacterium]|nr:sulfatase-like hydrolase/transferase [Opitutaceae bacterium]